jgi:hypothetical protein
MSSQEPFSALIVTTTLQRALQIKTLLFMLVIASRLYAGGA